MADPIEANYTPDGDDWTVAVKGRGQTLTARAPGLIAARDRADQLVAELAPDEPGRKTVVHLLDGDAVEFTTAYLTARLAKPEPGEQVAVPAPTETPETTETPEAPETTEPAKAAATAEAAPPVPAPAPRAATPAPAEQQQEEPATSGT